MAAVRSYVWMMSVAPPVAPPGRRLARETALDWATAALLAFATIGSAWSAWQAARWGGVQAIAFGQANALRTKAFKADAHADMQTAIDVELFLDWVTAARAKDEQLAAFLRQRMRDEFKPALDVWLAPRTAGNPIPAGTPFEQSNYRLASREQAERYDRATAAAVERARQASQISNDFVFAVVFFTSTMALGGLTGRFTGSITRVSAAVLAALMFVCGVSMLALLPHHIGFSVAKGHATDIAPPRSQNVRTTD